MSSYTLNDSSLKKFAYDIYIRLSNKNDTVIVCIGSDRFVCDSLSPIVAEKLKSKYIVPVIVYGGFEYNINRVNLSDVLSYLRARHRDAQIIVVDAGLGETIGTISIVDKCYPGLNKLLPLKPIGDFSLLGVVGKKYGDFNLNSTRLGLVEKMASFISKGLAMAISVKKIYSRNNCDNTL